MTLSLLRGLALALLIVVRVRGADDNSFAAVRAADDERVAATMAGNRARLEAIYSEDLHYAHSSGKIDDKAAHLAGLDGRKNVYENFDYQTRDFRPAGPGIVLMTGRVVIHSRNAKGEHENDVSFLAVWREEKGQWKLVSKYPTGWELYDIVADRAEQHDVGVKFTGRVKSMSAQWDTWGERVGVVPWPADPKAGEKAGKKKPD